MKIVAQLAIVLASAVVVWAAGVPAIEVFLQAGQPKPVESQAALRNWVPPGETATRQCWWI